MKKFYFVISLALLSFFANDIFAQEIVHPTTITTGTFLGKTKPLRDFKPVKVDETTMDRVNPAEERSEEEEFEFNESLRSERLYPYKSTAQPQGPDPVWQSTMPNDRSQTRAPILNFAGQGSPYNPSDCNGAVGANHFMQGVNSSYEIYDKNTGNVVVSSTAFNTLFAGVTGADRNDGDIIVLYDDNADRWFASEFSIPSAYGGGNDMMLIAVSETNDPTGSWYRWSFDVDDLPDYMKFGIWEDGYYMADNNTSGNDIYVFERSVMLTGGASPQMVAFNNPNRPSSGFHCIEPLDNDGQWAPAGTPGQFITINDDAWGGGGDELWVFECDVDWTTPSNSTFARTQTITVPAFDSDFGSGWDNIAQPGTSQELDAIPQILMYRAQYRNFGTTQTIVCAHTVDVDNTDHAGIRWYELENSGSGWTVRQNGTYAPDADSRWIPSITMDGQHNISLAYSISSTTTYPGIRYCAQSAAENASASGVMDIAEEVIQTGTQSQTSSNRWGDYAEMSIDPVDDVTFWFTTQYTNSGVQTKIANWRFGVAALPPNTNFVINTPNTLIRPVPLLEGDDATYTNLTTGTVDTWAWTFEGGNPNTSNQQDPGTINYPTAGLYYSELTATNTYGDSTLTRQEYIRVIDPNNVFCDTILQFYGTPTIYTSTGGYVGGTNEYDCNAIAEKFENFTPYNKLTGGRFFWAKATNGTSPTVTFAVWNDDGSGNPGTQIATKTVALADIVNDAATLGYTDIAFDADVILPSTGAFFIGFEIPGDAVSGDTLAIVTNSDGDGPDNTGYSLYSSWSDYSAWSMTLMNAILAYGCYDPDLAPVADFVGNPTTVNAGSTVDFTDLSYGGAVTSWSWDFPGGTPSTSTTQNPTITYNTPGYYDVTLTVTNANGTDTETKTSYIHVVDANSCSCSDLGNVVGSEVLYSTGSGYVSGNNNYGDLAKAEYFDNYAPYTNLEGAYFSFGFAWVDNASTNITINVWADDGGNSGAGQFTYSPGTILATTTVNINDIKNDIDNGDSTYVSFGSINIPGNFYVGFIIPDPTGGGDSIAVRTGQQNAGTDKGWEQWDSGDWYSYEEAGWGSTFNNAIYPVVCSTGAPMPDFEANNTIIAAGNTVDFTDLSTCSPTSWDWSFSGGTPNTSTNQNPAITYNTAGTYDVTLSSTNTDGSNSEMKTAYITVLEPIVYWDFPNDPDNDLSDGGIPANTGTKSITTFGGAGTPSFGTAGASTNAAIARTWDSGADTKGWQVDFTTTGYGSLMLYSKQNGDDRSPEDWKVQYSTDGATWTDLPGATITCANDWTTGVLNGVSLPASLENQTDVYLRWIMTTNDGINGTISNWRDNLIDDIMVVGIAIGAPPIADFTADNTSICEGQTVNFTDNSSDIPTSWSWDFGDGSTSTLQNPSHVYASAGTYTVVLTATNAAGSDTETKTNYITVNPNPTVSTSVTDVSCYGGNDGDATATPAGGQTPYSYSWNTGGTTATITGLTAGTYNVTVTDANTCTGTGSATVGQPASALSASITATTNVDCYGDSDGSATVTTSGGTSPYTYAWPSSNTGATETGLAAGTYVVTVTDAGSCTATASATISQPASALSTSISANDVNCNGGNDGDATVTATGGTSPYTYSWSNSATTATISSLTAGTYSVTVTDGNGCTSVESITINEPATALSTSISGNDVNCNGGNDGDATVTATGGTSPYTYSWSNGGTTNSISGLTAGTYTCTITDANSCSNTESITINEPATGLSTSISGNDVSCNGANDGNATVTATDGTSPYTYSWSNGDLTNTISGLSAGTFTCTITDAGGCSNTESIVINEPSALSTSISGTDVDCNGNSTGSASVTASGATTPYSYSWSTGDVTNTINNLTAGSYTCTITDANGCNNTESITITEPNALTLSIAGTDANCNGSSDGSATATVNGGTTAYNYAWSSGGSSATETGLAAGTYTLTVTDANSCTISDNVTINEPSAIVITETHNDATCGNSDGSITASATGGAGSYSYDWSNGDSGANITGLAAGNYTVTVTDGNTCSNTLTVSISNVGGPSLTMSSIDVTCNGGSNGEASVTATGGTTPYTYIWSSGGTTDTETGLTAGTYTVTVSDGNSCSASGNVTVNEPNIITVVETITNVTCNGGNDGEISIIASGGSGAYFYSWSTGSNTPTATGLYAGNVSVTVTDAADASCSQIFGPYTINEPTAITATQSVTDATCYGGSDGSATVNVSGGTSPYTYAWSSGGNGATETGLSAGSYSVTITDNNSCTTIENITVGEGAEIVLTMNSSDATCGSSNGTADVSVSGGTPSYTYLWNTSETTDNISNLAAGAYSVTVTDANGCNANSTVNVGNIGGPTLSMTTTDVSCFGANDATATVTATGGTTPYTYAWSSGGNTDTETGLSGGTYTVTVTDASTCSSTAIATINEPSEITVSETITNATCAGCTDGSISLVVTGGTSAYTYVWSSGGNSDTETGLGAGSYSVTITDANGCTDIETYTITEPNSMTITIVSTTDVSCFGSCDGSATISVAGGTSPYTYAWPTGGVGTTENGLCAGTYTVTVTDASSAIATQDITINEPTEITITFAANDANCGVADGSATATVSGGTSPYTYLWSSGSTTDSETNIDAGTYYLTVTDASSCSNVDSVTINNIGGPTLSFTSIDVSCYGLSDGQATVTATGGSSPYTYTWTTGGTNDTETGLSAGTFTVTVTDATSCSSFGSVTITEPTEIVATETVTDVSCSGSSDGSIAIVVSGGSSPYNYNWSSGGTNATETDLAGGTYSVTVTDNNGCTFEGTYTINEGPALNMSIVSTSDVSCNGGNNGSATINLDGGTAPVTYTWNSGVIGNTIYNLEVGTFYVTAVDANGCTADTSVTINEPTAMQVDVTTVDAHCGNSDGSATVVVNGGTSPYNYLWSDGSTNDGLTDLAMGIYIVTVTDDNGCQQVITNVINNSDAPEVTIIGTDVSCNSGNNGTLTSYVTGGTSPYNYAWSTGSTDENLDSLYAGEYVLTVTDDNNCASISTYKITQPDVGISITPDITEASCLQKNDASIQLDVEFGTEPYIFEWDNGEKSDYLENITSDIYMVTITDANNCKTTDSIYVGSVLESCLHVYNTLTPNGDGRNDTWIIDGMDEFPNANIKVFNQWGSLVWEHSGYYEAWDGTNNGNLLPAATYYYIIDLGNGDQPIRGDLTLVISGGNKMPDKPKTALPIMRKDKPESSNQNDNL